MKLFLICLLLQASVITMAKVDIIYGEDNRSDIMTLANPAISEISKSIAGRVFKRGIKDIGNNQVDFGSVDPLSSPFIGNVCTDEKFATQPSLSDCTGFLVGEDLLVTAGHCVADLDQTIENKKTPLCKAYSWVFDYKKNKKGDFNLEQMNKDNVYNCGKVIFATLTVEFDYAIIQLDRKVVGRSPLKLNLNTRVNLEQKLFVIGHPSGLPMKYADGAKVFGNFDNYFSTNLDTFGGNSGSPVFNAKTMEVVGILVRGDDDYVSSKLDGRSCMRVNTCDANRENCQSDDPRIDGEHVSYIDLISKFL
jgi:V8-like Glu-specific endopeptidase